MNTEQKSAEKSKAVLLVGVLVISVFVAYLLLKFYVDRYVTGLDAPIIKLIAGSFGLGFTVSALIFYTYSLYRFSKYSNTNNELHSILTERKEITNKIEQKQEPSIFDTLRLNLNHVSEYYTINKSQAKNSFVVSLSAAILGLLVIVSGIIIFYTNTQQNINLAFLTGISGLLLEFIGGAYFFMYKKSLEQVNYFFGQLIKVQDTMLAISLSENIEEVRKTDAKDKIITSLLERSLK